MLFQNMDKKEKFFNFFSSIKNMCNEVFPAKKYSAFIFHRIDSRRKKIVGIISKGEKHCPKKFGTYKDLFYHNV